MFSLIFSAKCNTLFHEDAGPITFSSTAQALQNISLMNELRGHQSPVVNFIIVYSRTGEATFS